MEQSEKSIRLVTALVECRPDGEYAPWGIKWYDGTVYPFDGALAPRAIARELERMGIQVEFRYPDDETAPLDSVR